jgi:F0F1-type ATP synthase membrane subunit b/b'
MPLTNDYTTDWLYIAFCFALFMILGRLYVKAIETAIKRKQEQIKDEQHTIDMMYRLGYYKKEDDAARN